MPLRGPSGLPARIIQVLRDFLPAELALIDGEEGEFTTPSPAAGSYHEWDRPLIPVFPAITLAALRARPRQVHAQGFGNRLDATYEVDIKVHVQISAGSDDARRLQNLCFRYAMGVERVLCHTKDQLQTAADPTPYASECAPRSMEWGPTQAQESGQQTRTATVGVDVRKIETR